MSMLARYRKTGGFEQLRMLLENCDAKKRDHLLKVIETEDKQTAALLKTKVLTFDRIMSWSEVQICEISSRMTDPTLIIALFGLAAPQIQKVIGMLPHVRKQNLETSLAGVKPSTGEQEAARIKFVQKARELEREKIIDMVRIDPTLEIVGIKVA